ncbi:hypothetical protein ATANTOWER_022493, partial [Ataeniobius toweri]|nr:hypothetical protein [Ataeniobius toweri]
ESTRGTSLETAIVVINGALLVILQRLCENSHRKSVRWRRNPEVSGWKLSL